MRICFIGPANSAHIIKWCGWFQKLGHEMHVVSFVPGEIPGTQVHLVDVDVDANGSDLAKLKYLLTGGRIRKIVLELKPDVVNVHYATSYGAAVAMSGLKGYALSVWGSDIYDFPRKSVLHKMLLQFSLKKAAVLFSTSEAMAEEAKLYTKKPFEITPFGVDMALFSPDKRTRGKEDSSFVIGTVKGLSAVYGIRYLLEAAAELKQEGKVPVRLRIAGRGPQEEELRSLAQDLGVDDITDWLGFISQEQAAREWANMDVAVIPSLSESFGVSAIEAQACGTPVIVSAIPGLMETTNPGHSSLVVRQKDPHEIAEGIRRLYHEIDYRNHLGENGRQYVQERYELNKCFQHILHLFMKLCG